MHYEDENGNLHNIDTDLYDESDLDQIDFPVAKEGIEEFRIMRTACRNMKKKNILDRDMMDYQGLKVPFDFRIPRNFKRGYTVGKGADKLRFIPVGASTAKGYIEQDRKNCVHYQDAWNDVDVRLELLPTGVKETLILKSDRAPASFSFEVDGPLEDDLTAGNLKLQPAWLVDANGEHRDVLQTVRREGDKTYVDLIADVTGLTYPIEIDPTVQTTESFYDTYVTSVYPNYNYDTREHISVGFYIGEQYNAYLQWTMPTSILGTVITNANLKIYKIADIGDPSWYRFRPYVITSDWSENGSVTFNSPPATLDVRSPDLDGDFTAPSTWGSIPVKECIQHYANGGAFYGIALRWTSAIGDGGYSLFASSEHPNYYGPYLEITYNVPPTAPTVTSPNGGETWNSLHTITWSGAIDPDGTPDVTTGTAVSSYASPMTVNGPIGQQFIATKTGKLGAVDVLLYSQSGTTSATLNVELWALDGNGLPSSKLHEQSFNVTVPNANTWYNFIFSNPPNITNGVKYGLIVRGAPSSLKFVVDTTGTYSQCKRLDWNGSSWFANANNFDMKMYFSPSNTLQYQIQLSTNNGQSWKDIVALTSPGATSYTYDFINEPETSLAKIRIRAYDGTSYGPWDESNGVFTIQHNQAPTVPTNLSPSGGVAKDRGSVIRLSWQHNDANNDPQAKFDLQWRLQGAQTWNTVTQVTTNQYWDAPANTFPKGTIEWQVRTYDQAGLSSPYSDTQVFFAGDKPTSPTITDPVNGATVPVANPVVQWSSVGQTAYHVKLLESNDNLLWELQANSTNKAQTIQYNLANSTAYKIQVAIKNDDGIWSDFVTVNIHVSYTPPAVSVVTTAKGEATITISIDNPTPQGTQPNVSYNEVYRRKQGESTWTRIAKNIPADASFVDYTPASGQVYQYLVRAWGDNGTYSDSPVVSESISFIGVWLHEAANPLETLHQFKLVSDRSGNWQPTATMMQFAGRRLPVAEYDDTEQHSVSVKFSLLKDSGDLEALEKLIRSKNTLCYRDARGRKMFCHVFQLPVDDEVYGNTVSLTFEEVSYTEEV
ncbi:DNRLRE domain-containing protein [Anoxybacillus rupiensis]|uniref:DNRLRE domain-containing protein n=1 Tax=Anoxybacteroides rupiense TaxID=311460 RepID=A0ABD5IWX6_9BACL|nr:DNRLRE domain-containing protein [Anoxybacillus rupiensis]